MDAPAPDVAHPSAWPPGAGEMAKRIRGFDWTATPLGPMSGWPQSLKTLVELMLAAPQPASIGWGPELSALYNDGHIPIVGTKHPTALGQPYGMLWPESWEELAPVAAATLAGQPHTVVDRPVPRRGDPDRPLSWFTSSWTPVRDDDGSIAGFYCAATETTERVLAEAALRAREDQLAALTTAIDDVFYVTDLEHGKLEYLSPAYEHIWGRAAADLLADLSAFPATIHPADRETFAAGKVAQARGDAISIEYRIVRPDGKVRWIRDRAFPVAGAAGKRSAGVAADITARKRTEDALRASEEKFRTLANISPALIWHNDPEGRNVYHNQSFLAFSGKQAKEIHGTGWRSLVHPDDAAAYLATYDAAVGNQRVWHDRCRLRRRDGEWHWLDSYADPIFDPDGTFLGHVGVSTDITATVAAEAALRASEERQSFLLRLSDALQPLSDPVAIQQTAARVLGDHLQADRAYYGEIDDVREVFVVHRDYVRGNVGSVAGKHPFAAYGPLVEAIRQGLTFVTSDTQTDPRIADADRPTYAAISLRSFVSVHLVKGNVPVCGMAVTQATPRDWSEQEIDLTRETAERTWAAVERAHAEAALREKDVDLSLALQAANAGLSTLDLVTGRGMITPEWSAVVGLPPGLTKQPFQAFLALVHPDDRARVAALHAEAADGSGLEFEFRVDHPVTGERWLLSRSRHLTGPGGGPGRLVGIAMDITDRRRAEAALRESEASLQVRVAEATTELRALSRRLLLVQEEERRHLARELHDEVGQLLTGLGFQLLAARSAGSAAALTEAEATVRQLTEQVRQLSMDLRPQTLDQFGLAIALETLVGTLERRTGLVVALRLDGVAADAARMPAEIEIATYRIVQEALTNVVRHAAVRHASVQMWRHHGELAMLIQDAGRGFDEETLPRLNGLRGMQERAELLGGVLTVQSAPGRGTTISVVLPVAEEAAID